MQLLKSWSQITLPNQVFELNTAFKLESLIIKKKQVIKYLNTFHSVNNIIIITKFSYESLPGTIISKVLKTVQSTYPHTKRIQFLKKHSNKYLQSTQFQSIPASLET